MATNVEIYRENQRLKKENERLKKEIEETKKSKKKEDTNGWDFHYNGHGDYEEQRRCFYGDFG